MIRISNLRISCFHSEEDLRKKAARALRLLPRDIRRMEIVRRSLDARKKGNLLYLYTLDVEIAGREEAVLKKCGDIHIGARPEERYHFPGHGENKLKTRPVIAGFGPAGMFAALYLARAGFMPLILERGEDVDSRTAAVRKFWETGDLNPESNVQFGEGGAGTFSDGKLNTLVKDPDGRGLEVMKVFVEAGADSSILYDYKPHIGTDVLARVVKNIRLEILRLGGEIRFLTKLTDIGTEGGRLVSVTAGGDVIPARVLIFAAGHSARDTFSMLAGKSLLMEPKAFAVGIRIQHPQSMINLAQYGFPEDRGLGAANYRLSLQASTGRGIYSFCMCPGGYVVNSSSEQGRLAVNGMSYHDRGGENANSALIVSVTPSDFPSEGPLGGLEFQRRLEEKAFREGNGKIPVQLYGDFKMQRVSREFGDVNPAFRGETSFGNLRNIFPEELNRTIIEGIESFAKKIEGYDRPDAILAGVESRTSSPLRIRRDPASLMAGIDGFYPCGEGAGYAGGITSAAMDGMRIAEAVAKTYCPAYE